LLASSALLLLVARAHAQKFMIASTPPGATVEIDGAVIGTTPYAIAYPGGYFHKPHTVFGTRLEHAMLMRYIWIRATEGVVVQRPF
jgi:hypothetical protein